MHAAGAQKLLPLLLLCLAQAHQCSIVCRISFTDSFLRFTSQLPQTCCKKGMEKAIYILEYERMQGYRNQNQHSRVEVLTSLLAG